MIIKIDTTQNSAIIVDDYTCSGVGLPSLLNKKDNLIGLEIGCSEATTSFYLLDNLPNLTLHAIDPYLNYMDWNGRFLDDREELYQKVIKKMEKFGDRFVLHRKLSDEIVSNFKDEYFDLIFIDGLHTYDQVKRDCENYYSKAKIGSIFSGHDYNVIAEVNKAVNEFASAHNKQISNTNNDVWYWVK